MRALSQKHQVTVLVRSIGHSNERLAGLTVEVYPESALSRLRISALSVFGRRADTYDLAFPSLRFLFRRFAVAKCDVVHVRYPIWLLRSVRLMASLRSRPVLTYEQMIFPEKISLPDTRIFPLVAAPPDQKRRDDYPPPNFIPLTIDLARDFGDTICPPYREDGAAPLRLMHVGKLIERKGQEIVFEALSVLIAQGLNVQLSMYSHNDARSFQQGLFETLSKLGIAEHVEFIPPKCPDEMMKEFRKHHVFVYSGWVKRERDTDEETYARATGACGTRLYSMIEAMAAGLPVVCAAERHIVGAVENGGNGLVFEKGDAQDLAEKIQQISRMDLAAMGARSRALIEAHHNAKDFPARFEQLLEQSAS